MCLFAVCLTKSVPGSTGVQDPVEHAEHVGTLGALQLRCEDSNNEEVRSLHDRTCQRLRTNGDGRCSTW